MTRDSLEAVAEAASYDALAADYRQWIRRGGLSDHTKRAYPRAVHDFLDWLARHPEHAEALADGHARDYAVRDYKRERLSGEATGRKMGAKTVQLDMTALQSFFAWRGQGRPDVKQIRIQRSAPKCLDAAETRAVLRAAELRGRRDHALVFTTLVTGIRLKELQALDVDDLELNARKSWLHVRLGKGDQPRSVTLDQAARELERWLAIRRDWAGADSPALWLSRRGRRLAMSSIDMIFDETGRAALVQKEGGKKGEMRHVPLSAHILRHTRTADLLRAGVDPVTVANMLGHSDTKTITTVYGQPTRDVIAAAADRVTYDY